jgi:triosephosphate isomerase
LVKPLLKGWSLAAQNCSATAAGAFTGEASASVVLRVTFFSF